MAGGLTEQQVRDYWRDGFIVVRGVLAAAHVERLRAAAETPAIAAMSASDTRTVHLMAITTRHPAFRELAAWPAIVDCLRPLLGDDIQLQHSKLTSKPRVKDAGAFAMHQDFSYYPHTNTDLLSVMVAIDPVRPENGCMQMLPGSHRLGLLDHRAGGRFTGNCQAAHLWEGAAAASLVDLVLEPGDIGIHHCLTLHGSGPNRSTAPRRAPVFSYRADDAHQLADTIQPDCGIMVSGRRQGRVRCTEGTWVLPDRSGEGRHAYGSAWHQLGEAVEL